MTDNTEPQGMLPNIDTDLIAPDPIEPGRGNVAGFPVFRLILFVIVLIYVLLSYFHAPIFTRIGEYLILEHPPEKSEMIICLSGGNIERGMAAADAYNEGLAPVVYISRETLPDGFELLEDKGVEYPESADLMDMLLRGLGVSGSSIIKGDKPVDSTLAEATLIREEVEKRGFKSIIVITSPQHTRRSWITFDKVFEGMDVKILMQASKYSGFSPDRWWKERKYIRDVILEYQKLLYYVLKY